MKDLTPRQIVESLDRFIVGQEPAKRAVAVAIRNRWRRQQLAAEVAREIAPRNIVMMGPTGVGKTEIARRLADLTGAPFVKVEATRFTEVGYHGRDVESMVRDLLEQSIGLVRREQAEEVAEAAAAAAEKQLLDLLLPGNAEGGPDAGERREQVRSLLADRLAAGSLDDREVEVVLRHKPSTGTMFANMGLDQMDPEMAKMFENIVPERSSRRKMPVREARRILIQQQTDALLDEEKLVRIAIERAEQSGIIFIDEIDKVATPASSDSGGRGADVSRQGVQRDLLPIVEGAAVTTRHGVVRTDHVLFIAAGAFHQAAVSDLMPELQGRFPIRVELSALTESDFVRILTEPGNALTRQQEALLGTEGIEVSFDDEAITAMASLAVSINRMTENIGARRLMTIVERLFEKVSFDAPELSAAGDTTLRVTREMVESELKGIAADEDLSRFVL